MSGSEVDPPDDDMEMLAAELMLGLLTTAQLPHVVAQRHGSDRFDRAVNQWEFLLLPLTDEIEPVQPPTRLWPAIAASIAPIPVKGSIWNNLKFWRGFGVGTSVIGLGLAAALAAIILTKSPPALPVATAMLTSASSGAFVATASQMNGGIQLVVSPSSVTLPANKSAELWLILPGAKPAPLGLLGSSHSVAVTIAASGLGANIGLAELAVSIEPPGGSPTGQPTGPIISAAKFSPI